MFIPGYHMRQFVCEGSAKKDLSRSKEIDPLDRDRAEICPSNSVERGDVI